MRTTTSMHTGTRTFAVGVLVPVPPGGWRS